eukprot:Platyproteum_vivax@DN5157_c0_g1_i1.p1
MTEGIIDTDRSTSVKAPDQVECCCGHNLREGRACHFGAKKCQVCEEKLQPLDPVYACPSKNYRHPMGVVACARCVNLRRRRMVCLCGSHCRLHDDAQSDASGFGVISRVHSLVQLPEERVTVAIAPPPPEPQSSCWEMWCPCCAPREDTEAEVVV